MKALDESLDDVRSGLEAAASNLKQGLTKHGVEMQLDIGQLEPVAQPTVAIVEVAPSASGTGDWIGRAPFAMAATVFNPLYAVAGVVGIIFDRHRVKRRAQREQLSRQVTETVNETRAQLSVAVHHTVVNGQSVLTEAFEDAAEQRREQIEEEIGALQAQTSMSESKRTQRAKDARGAPEPARRPPQTHRGHAPRSAGRSDSRLATVNAGADGRWPCGRPSSPERLPMPGKACKR